MMFGCFGMVNATTQVLRGKMDRSTLRDSAVAHSTTQWAQYTTKAAQGAEKSYSPYQRGCEIPVLETRCTPCISPSPTPSQLRQGNTRKDMKRTWNALQPNLRDSREQRGMVCPLIHYLPKRSTEATSCVAKRVLVTS